LENQGAVFLFIKGVRKTKDINIVESKGSQVDEFSSKNGVFKAYEDDISVFTSDINIATDETSYYSEDSETGQLTGFDEDKAKKAKKQKKKQLDYLRQSAKDDYKDFVKKESSKKSKSSGQTGQLTGFAKEESKRAFDFGYQIGGETAKKASKESAKKAVADTVASADVEPVSRATYETAKAVKKALEKAEKEYKKIVIEDEDEEQSKNPVGKITNTVKSIYGKDKSENEELWSQGENATATLAKGCGCSVILVVFLIITVMSNSLLIGGGAKVLFKAWHLTKAYNSYVSVFEGKSAYSGTGKAKNLTEYCETVERPLVEKYCEQFDLQGWEEVCLALCMVESGGTEEYSSNAMGVIYPASNGISVQGFYSGTVESAIYEGVETVHTCCYYYEYYLGKEAAPTDTDCILTVVMEYNQGIEFPSYLAENCNGEFSEKACDDYAIMINKRNPNNMFMGSYYLNDSDGNDYLDGRQVPIFHANFLYFFDLTKSQTAKVSTDDNYISKVVSFIKSLSTSGGGASAMAEIAQNELGNYGDKYWAWANSGTVDWCCIFATWCADQAGLSDEIPYCAGCTTFINTLVDQTKCKGSSFTPSVGDLITFVDHSDGLAGHIAIVTRVEDGRVYYIGGNQGQGDSARNTGQWCSYSIVTESSIALGSSEIYKYYHFD
jgi:hypothetical protein